MAKFCELGIESDVVIGKGIEIEDCSVAES